MGKGALTVICIAFLQLSLQAQLPARSVRSTGSASVSLKPDQMLVNIGVTTQGATAQEAAELNATQMTTVLNQIRAVLGPGAEIKTVGYSVAPKSRRSAIRWRRFTGIRRARRPC